MEQEQSSVEQWSKILLQLETLRTELHGMVDAHIDVLRYQLLTGELPEQQLRTRPLRADPYAFKGEKPESIQLPDGREVKTPTWKTAVLAIFAGLQRRTGYACTAHGAARQDHGPAAHDPRGLTGGDACAAGN